MLDEPPRRRVHQTALLSDRVGVDIDTALLSRRADVRMTQLC